MLDVLKWDFVKRLQKINILPDVDSSVPPQFVEKILVLTRLMS